MGQEAKCTARVAGKKVEGRLQLESDTLLFRSPDARLEVSVGEISNAHAESGVLIIRVKRQTYEFNLGKVAERWAHRIMNPPSLVDKLGVKAGSDVTFIGHVDDVLLGELKKAQAKVSTKRPGRVHDWIFVGVEKPAELDTLKGLDAAIKPNGGIWVIFPKGRPELKAANLIAAAKAYGLVDNKIARVSDRLTGMKFVIPLNRRK